MYFQFLFPTEIITSPSPKRIAIGLGNVNYLHKHKHLFEVCY